MLSDAADREAFFKLTPEQKSGFYASRGKLGMKADRNSPYEGAALYTAGLGSAYIDLAKKYEKSSEIAATPFEWIEPTEIPRRTWLYGHHYVRRFLSTTTALSGVGKSSISLVEILAICTGKPLLGIVPDERVNCWVWNLEDPAEELQRRIMAAVKHYDIKRSELAGRLFVDSGRDMKLTIAEQARGGAVEVNQLVVDAIVETIRQRKIGLLVVDPLVAAHRVQENDNGAIEAVADAFARIADAADCAVELIHHSKKTGGAEVTVDDARGASALLAKARSARVVNVMTQEEAGRAGVENRRRYFRCESGKSSMSTPADKADWHFLESVDLGNGCATSKDQANGFDFNHFDRAGLGDQVGVVVKWAWPDALADVKPDHLRQVQQAVANGRWRENSQAKDWVGKAVAKVLGLDATDKAHRSRIISMLKIWIANGMFVIVEGEDEKRMKRPFVEVGEWAS